MRNWKSREVLLCSSEPPPVDDADVTLPAQTAAATKLLPPEPEGGCIKETRIDGLDATSMATQKSKSAPNGRRPIADADAVHLEALLQRRPIWYRNWTNAGIALCLLYNLCIVFLLLMGYFHFTKS